MKHYITLLLVSLNFSGIAQTKDDLRAEAYFQDYGYTEAVQYFSYSSENYPKKSRELAVSHYHLGDLDKSAHYYNELMGTTNKTSEDMYQYAQVLMMLNRHTEAMQVLDEFSRNNPTDSRSIAYQREKNPFGELKKDKGRFTLDTLTINSAFDDFGPVYYKDQLIFCSAKRKGNGLVKRVWTKNDQPYLDLYETPASIENQGMKVKQWDRKLNRKLHEGPVSFGFQDSVMAVTSNDYQLKGKMKTNRLKIDFYKLKDNKWEFAEAFFLNNADYSVAHPGFSPDGKWLYFASDMPGGFGGADIYRVKINADGSYGNAENLGKEVNSEGDELFPSVHEKGYLFFSSNGKVGLGGLDIFVARVDEDGAVGKIENAGVPVNSERDDFSFILDGAMKRGYLASSRPGGEGGDDIYGFEMIKPFTRHYKIEGLTTSRETGLPVKGAIVSLAFVDGTVKKYVSDASGNYNFDYEEGMVPIAMSYEHADYKSGKLPVDFNEDITSYERNIQLEDKMFMFEFIVNDVKTLAPVSNVKIELRQVSPKNESIEYTDTKGRMTKDLVNKKEGDKLSYVIKLSKEGYLTKEFVFDHTLKKDEYVIQLHKYLKVDMTKIEKGVDIAKAIEMKPIYFDMAKADIRPDAKTELDKIINIMNENPKMIVVLKSHTDCRSSKSYNLKLSDKRAKASAEYIKKRISNPKRISGKGYGESQPVNECECEGTVMTPCSEDQHQANRRTEFVIVSF